MNMFFRGIWASVIATSSMTLAMFQWFTQLPLSQKKPLPPAQLTHEIGRRIGLTNDSITDELKKEMTLISHYGYGAACGILYASIASKVPVSPLVKGGFFGIAVWAVSYYGLIPGIGLQPAAQRMSKERNFMMLLAHIVWGASLGYSEERLRKQGYQMLSA